MIRHVVQERVRERFDAGRNHVVHRAEVDDEVDALRRDLMLVQEGLDLDLEVAFFEFRPGQTNNQSAAWMDEGSVHVNRTGNSCNGRKVDSSG